MLLVRSWPAHPPPGRCRVEDDAVRLVNDNYEYRGLVDFGDDILQLDWDVAVSKEDLVSFAARARCAPSRPLAAPYLIYPDTRPGLVGPTWSCRRYIDDTESSMRYISRNEPTTHLFGFGMVYLPRDLIAAFVEAWPVETGRTMDDNMFSAWHHANVEPETRLDWNVHPVHLNYSPARLDL
jgi:hypothetical protein